MNTAIPSKTAVSLADKAAVATREPTYVLGDQEREWIRKGVEGATAAGKVLVVSLRDAYGLFDATEQAPDGNKLGDDERVSYGMQRALQRAGLNNISIGKTNGGAALVFRPKRSKRVKAAKPSA